VIDMPFRPFAMERWQSTWENRVRFNLSESGVRALCANELAKLAGDDAAALLDAALGYPQSNGTEELRSSIAAIYPGATAAQVLVTTGSSEANFVNVWALVEPGDAVAIVVPTYMQTWGLANALGAQVRPIWLREELAWQPDPGDVTRAIAPGTKLVVVTNPNNPTGAILSSEAMDHIARRADEVGAWLLADEVFLGAERSGTATASFWGRGERVVVVGGLSKAYGLPGLRIGWSVASSQHATAIWHRKEYTTIAPTTLGDALAAVALRPDVRPRVLARTRAIVRDNWQIVERWLRTTEGELRWRAPDAGAIVWVRYREPVRSTAIAETLRAEQDVLVVPGEHFEMDGFVRLGFGMAPADLEAALARVLRVLGRAAGPT
jgi:aspartate/methionine/tyrosine aminotransferase